jgi:exopolysaccharide biosynthesis WecB/TagA/CpsF family protein/anti-anti-sigma factor
MLEILRSADLINADGMPLVWLSKLLGAPLKERVAGADLVPELCEAAALHNARVFLLGGQEEITNKAAEKLVQDNPGLEICGVATPFVNIEGEKIDDEENDRQLVEQINQAKPDILFIGFGNPKQLVWFQRNRDRLEVPVSIGVGGTFDFIADNVKRAPVWMQKNGLEWIYRLTQDPKRLWKRYVVGLAKFSVMALPLMVNHYLNKPKGNEEKTLSEIVVDPKIEKLMDDKVVDSFFHNGERYRVLSLPKNIDESWYEKHAILLQFQVDQDGPLIFDFADVEQMDSKMISFLVKAWGTDIQKQIFGINLTNNSLIRSLSVNRAYDTIKNRIFSSTTELLRVQSQEKIFPDFYYLLNYQNNVSVIRLVGRLDFAEMRKINFEELFSSTLGQPTVLDLSELEFVDSSGLVFFIKFKNYFEQINQPLSLCNLNTITKQIFKITKLTNLFDIETDKSKSVEKLEVVNG